MTPKPPTPQAISALLRKAGHVRAEKLANSGNTRGFKVSRSRMDDGVVLVNFWEHSDLRTDPAVHRQMLARYAEDLAKAGWGVETALSRGGGVPRHLIVTAPDKAQEG